MNRHGPVPVSYESHMLCYTEQMGIKVSYKVKTDVDVRELVSVMYG